MAFVVTKDTTIGDILDHDQSTAPYFLEMGMHCLGLSFCQEENRLRWLVMFTASTAMN